MKRYVLILLALSLTILAGCGQKNTDETTLAATTQATTAPAETAQTVPPTTAAPTEETEVPTVEVVHERHPLNGSPLEKPFTKRPFAVVINNYIGAMPQCSVAQADVVCEVLAEGGITRYLAIYDSLEGIDHIGSIRSARPYLVDVAQSFGAVFVHHGGSRDGYGEISDLGADDLDAMTNAGYAYYRDQNRLDAGYDLEHTSFADGDRLIEAAENRGYEMEVPDGLYCGLEFEDAVMLKGEKAENMRISFNEGGKTTDLRYDAKTKMYQAMQYDDDYIDGNTGESVSFRNMLYITAETYNYTDSSNTVRLEITLTGEGDGYFACGGQIVPIHWSRESRTAPFQFTMEDGSPLKLSAGTTYFAIAPLGGVLEYE